MLSAPFRSLAAAAFVGLVVSSNAHASGKDDATPTPKHKVAVLKIGGSFGEDPAPANPLGPTRRNFRGKIELIRQIAADPEIAGVELKVTGMPDFARSLDLLHELRALKAAGKKITCYAETMSQTQLMFASISDLVALPPSGGLTLTGLMAEIMYYKDMLAHLDVKMDVIHIGAFKSAFENFAKNRMSDENRMVLNLLLDENYGQLIRTIADNRGMSEEQVEAMFEKMLVEPDDALAAGLIDAVAYEDQYEAHRERLIGGEVELVKKYGQKKSEDLEEMMSNPLAMFTMLPKLLKPAKKKLPNKPRIAIVYATGPIMSGKSQTGFDGTVASMGSETLVKALEEAAEDDWVKAVILRVNSPGGSALASDMIWRATQRVKAKKPIISSMGGVAASGGYWISMGCDRIMAQPSTLTGSIGVVGMLPDVSQALENIGINVEVVGKGPHVEAQALLKNGPTPVMKQKIKRSMEHVYDEFIRKVSEGRHMNAQIVESLARGRVWTGRQAADLNLVDQLGGLDDAIGLACELAGLDPADTPVAEFPEAPDFFTALEEALEGMVSVRAQMRGMLAEAGFGDLVMLLDHLQARRAVFDREMIQAVMPFAVTVR